MTAYLTRRLGTSIVILLGISIFIFALLHAVFPSPAIVVLGPKAQPAAIKAWDAAALTRRAAGSGARAHRGHDQGDGGRHLG